MRLDWGSVCGNEKERKERLNIDTLAVRDACLGLRVLAIDGRRNVHRGIENLWPTRKKRVS